MNIIAKASNIDAIGNPCKSARFRLNNALFLFFADRMLPEAEEFAKYSVEKFRECGKFAANDIQEAQNLLKSIERV